MDNCLYYSIYKKLTAFYGKLLIILLINDLLIKLTDSKPSTIKREIFIKILNESLINN